MGPEAIESSQNPPPKNFTDTCRIRTLVVLLERTAVEAGNLTALCAVSNYHQELR